MTPQQFNVFVKKQVEFGVLPKRLYAEGETFVQKLCEEREAFVNQIFAETYKEPKLYPYTLPHLCRLLICLMQLPYKFGL